MELIRSYILTVFATALLCAVTIHLAGERTPAVRLIASLFLTFCVLQPMAGTDLSSLIRSVQETLYPLTEMDAHWDTAGTQALRDGIQERTEAYILMEAKSLGAQISAEVSLSDDEIPVHDKVTIIGQLSPYQKTKLFRSLTAELGIAEEAVTWS